MTPSLHPYLRFRSRMARQALLRIIPSLSSSIEIIFLAFAPMLVGLLACIALPGLFAATLPWPRALALLAVQVLVATIPLWLLRKHLHPAEVTLWSRTLPISPRLRWSADALVAGLIIGPVALAFAVSIAIWFYQRPDWLRPVAGVALTVLSLLLAWLLSTLILAQRARLPPPGKPGRVRTAPVSYVPDRGMRGMLAPLHHWHRLFWLPFWRGDDVVGIRQTLLLAGAALSAGLWMWDPPLVPPAVWGASTTLLLMLLTDRGDKAVAEQIARLRPVAIAWPLDTQRLFHAAMALSLLPGLCVMAWFALLTLGRAANGYSHTAAIVWLCVAAMAQIAIVALRKLSPRGRVSLVIGATLVLSAIGSEVWN